jgi:hypothetical protein
MTDETLAALRALDRIATLDGFAPIIGAQARAIRDHLRWLTERYQREHAAREAAERAGDAVLERIERALGDACTGDLASDVERLVRERSDLARQAQLFRGALSGTMDTAARGHDEARYELARVLNSPCESCRANADALIEAQAETAEIRGEYITALTALADVAKALGLPDSVQVEDVAPAVRQSVEEADAALERGVRLGLEAAAQLCERARCRTWEAPECARQIREHRDTQPAAIIAAARERESALPRTCGDCEHGRGKMRDVICERDGRCVPRSAPVPAWCPLRAEQPREPRSVTAGVLTRDEVRRLLDEGAECRREIERRMRQPGSAMEYEPPMCCAYAATPCVGCPHRPQPDGPVTAGVAVHDDDGEV